MSDTTTGTCAGGPLHDKEITVRSAAGFLAVDKPAGLAWVYKPAGDGTFTVSTEHDDSLQYPYGPQTGQRTLQPDRAAAAAAVGALDVVALPGGEDS